MKKLFLVTSCIQTSDRPLSYSATRSIFSTEERLRQTLFTLNNISCVSPDADIIIIDASENASNYKEFISKTIPNSRYVNISDFCSSEDCQIIRTHKNKSVCEALLFCRFVEKYLPHLSNYNFIYKLSGRYFLSSDYIYQIKEFESLKDFSNKILFKQPKVWNWIPQWDDYYKFVDLRPVTSTNTLSEYDVRFFGFGIIHLQFFYNMYRETIIVDKESQGQYSLEVMFYFLSRKAQQFIVEKAIRVFGWEGPSGTFNSY